MQVLSSITYGATEIVVFELLADDYKLGLSVGEQIRSSGGGVILQAREMVPHSDNVTINDVNVTGIVPQGGGQTFLINLKSYTSTKKNIPGS